MEEKNKVVYLHKDKEDVVRYVGSGTEYRAYRTGVNSYRGKRYAEFVETNGKLEVEVVAKGLSKGEAEDLERNLFEKHKDTILNARRPNSVQVLTKEMFQKHLYYDETSKSCLRWKVGRVGANGSIKKKSDSEAGNLNKSRGYYVVRLKGKNYLAHRIIAVLHDLDVGGKVIDHIDRDKANNKISNLRAVSQKENMNNLSQHKLSSANTSGVQGVHYRKQGNRWVASWYEDGKQKLKCFPIKNYTTSEEAFQAACEYRNQMVSLHCTNNADILKRKSKTQCYNL